jgi:phytoene dehydrogenase-like protein
MSLWFRQEIQELLREGDFSLMPFKRALNRRLLTDRAQSLIGTDQNLLGHQNDD